MGNLVGIYIGKIKGEDKSSVESGELVVDHGLLGDSHAGIDIRRQVSLFSCELFNQLISEGFSITPESLSANLFTEALELDTLTPGERLRIGTSIIEIVESRTPCRKITKLDNRLPKRLYGQCGQLARVVSGGIINIDNKIELLLTFR